MVDREGASAETLATTHYTLRARTSVWQPKQETSMTERWAQVMQSTEQKILEGLDVVGAEAQRYMGRGAAPRWGDQESGA